MSRSRQQVAYGYVKDLVTRTPSDDSRFVTEGEIAAELAISRTPVREALRKLQAERLLELVPNKGAFIPPLPDRIVREVMESRTLVETFCAHRARSRGGDLDETLAELLAEQRRLTADVDAFIDCDRRFHSAIVQASGHEVFREFYVSLQDRQMRMGVRAVLARADRAEHVIGEHERIADALKLGDPAAVRDAIEDHITATLRTIEAR